MSLPDKQPAAREITYRVGWKKGKINVPDSAAVSLHAARSPASGAASPDPAHQLGKTMKVIWCKAPYPPLAFAIGMAVVLPALSFTAIVWLASRLSAGG